MGTNIPGSSLAGLQASKLPGAVQFAYSDAIDLTATGVYVVIPPVAARLASVAQFWEIRSTNTVTVAPTYSVGANSASFNNHVASVTTAGFTTQAAETTINAASVSPNVCVDLTASGLQVNVTGAATATALTARYVQVYIPLPV